MINSKKSLLLASMLLSSAVLTSYAKESYSSSKHSESAVGTYALTLDLGAETPFYGNISLNEGGTISGGNTIETGQAIPGLPFVIATPATGIWKKTDCGDYEVSWIHVVSTNAVPSAPAYWASFTGKLKLGKDCKKVTGSINLSLFGLNDTTFCGKPAVGPVAIKVTGSKLNFCK